MIPQKSRHLRHLSACRTTAPSSAVLRRYRPAFTTNTYSRFFTSDASPSEATTVSTKPVPPNTPSEEREPADGSAQSATKSGAGKRNRHEHRHAKNKPTHKTKRALDPEAFSPTIKAPAPAPASASSNTRHEAALEESVSRSQKSTGKPHAQRKSRSAESQRQWLSKWKSSLEIDPEVTEDISDMHLPGRVREKREVTRNMEDSIILLVDDFPLLVWRKLVFRRMMEDYLIKLLESDPAAGQKVHIPGPVIRYFNNKARLDNTLTMQLRNACNFFQNPPDSHEEIVQFKKSSWVALYNRLLNVESRLQIRLKWAKHKRAQIRQQLKQNADKIAELESDMRERVGALGESETPSASPDALNETGKTAENKERWRDISQMTQNEVEHGAARSAANEEEITFPDAPWSAPVEESGDGEDGGSARSPNTSRRIRYQNQLESRQRVPERAKERKEMQAAVPATNARYEVTTNGTLSPDSTMLETVGTVGGTHPPELAHDLSRVLFNPGVYTLRDPRSRVFNFNPSLANIIPVSDFDFSSMSDFVTSSDDTTLLGQALEHKKQYVGSSSSLTSTLSHFHHLVGAFRPLQAGLMSNEFQMDSYNFTRLSLAPSAIFLRYKNGVYAVDSDKEYDTDTILSSLGRAMEKMLTLPTEEYERYRKTETDDRPQLPKDEEIYFYSGFGKFLLRSQLDAWDKRLPGTGYFDLKTRAVAPIRMDSSNAGNGVGYEIRQMRGNWESYEREYFDMMRSTFLKYSLQARIGQMDGIFVAYHNIQRIFGFQYLSLGEMDQALHGTDQRAVGDGEFRLSMMLLTEMLDRAVARYPEQSLRIFFETRETRSNTLPTMTVVVRPMAEAAITSIQKKQQAQLEERGQQVVDEVVQPLSGAEPATPAAQTPAADVTATPPAEEDVAAAEMSCFTLTVRNQINDRYVTRVKNLAADQRWTLEYQVSETKAGSAAFVEATYRTLQKRREKALLKTDDDRWAQGSYFRGLQRLVQRGRHFRRQEDQRDAEEPVQTLG